MPYLRMFLEECVKDGVCFFRIVRRNEDGVDAAFRVVVPDILYETVRHTFNGSYVRVDNFTKERYEKKELSLFSNVYSQ